MRNRERRKIFRIHEGEFFSVLVLVWAMFVLFFKWIRKKELIRIFFHCSGNVKNCLTSASLRLFLRTTLTLLLHLYGDRFLKMWPTWEQGMISSVPPHIQVLKEISRFSAPVIVKNDFYVFELSLTGRPTSRKASLHKVFV